MTAGQQIATRHKVQLVALFSADVVSALGSRVSMVAIPWLVLVTTGSPAKMGLVAAASTVPYIVASVFGPPLADRFGLRRTVIVTDLGCSVSTALIAVTPDIGFGLLLAMVAAGGALRGIGGRAKHVMLKPVAEAAGARMVRVTAAYEGLNNGATLIGAPIGGLLIFWLGPQGAIWVDAVSYLACALIFVTLVKPAAAALPDANTRREPYLTALRHGASFLRQDRLLSGMLLMIFFVNVFTTANTSVFVPLWVDQVFGSAPALGVILGTFAAGAVIGNLAFTALAPKLPQYLTFTIGLVLCVAPRMIALGLSRNLALILAVTFLCGVAVASVNPILGAMLYDRIPGELQTRVFGLVAAVSFAGFPLGGVLGGWVVTWFGLTTAILLAAAACVLLTVVLPLVRYPWGRGLPVAAPNPEPEPSRS